MELGLVLGIIMWSIGTVGGIIAIYVRMETKLKELDVRVMSLEQTDKAMNKKLDDIIAAIHQLALDIKDKADRA